MKCDFKYCIYNKESACIKSEVKINSSGMCNGIFAVNIPDGLIEFYKETQIEELNETNNQLLLEVDNDSKVVYFGKPEKADSSYHLD